MSEIVVQVNRSASFKARAESNSKGVLGAGTAKQGRGQREPTDGLRSQHGMANLGPKGDS